MLIKSKSPVFVLLSSLLLSSLLFCLALEVPNQKSRVVQCVEQCLEREEEPSGFLREGANPEDPRLQFEECLEVCRKQSPRQRPQCEKRCKRQFEERERGSERDYERSEEVEEERDTGYPYFYRSQKLQSRFGTQHGHVRVLPRFSKRSELFQGIDNYRFAVLETNPNTFLVPHHCDSEVVFFVLRGKGTFTSIFREKRESHNLEVGDVMRISAGTTMYVINQDDNEKLRVAMLVQPVNTPGKFQGYFSGGGDNPESFYRVFSNDILETALATPRDELDRLFGQQKQGIILQAPKGKLKALTQHASSVKQRGRQLRDPFNLLNEKPLYSNKFGQFFEASPNDFKQLRDLDVSLGLADIKQGAMMVPHYNSKTTFIVMVVEGTGRIEMACPHVASQSRESQRQGSRGRGEEEIERSQQYEKISSQLSPGDIFIIPAGHPVAVLASERENLRTLGFGINAQLNQRNFLAGRDNIMNQVEREAKELCFNAPGELVERIFRNQKESHFVAGPQERHRREEEEGRGQPLESVFQLSGLF